MIPELVNISAEPKSDFLTVSELTAYLKRLIQSDGLLRSTTVMGEVTGFTRYKSGHIYFSLKDDRSVLKCAFFKNYHKEDYGFMEDGARVLVKGNIGVFEKRGEYQLYVNDAFDFGQGNILLKLEKLKKDLEKKGYFNNELKKELPKFPQKIGIVAAKESAGFQDILRVFRERSFSLDITVADCRVQGVGASKEIARAIRKLDSINELDLIIIARGGGAYEDLWSFNEMDVIDAIFECNHPVITGIGHEIDTTIADLVADRRAATPSQAAEFAFPDRIDVEKEVNFIKQKLYNIIKNKLDENKNMLANNSPEYSSRIIIGRLAQHSQWIDNLFLKLERSSIGKVSDYRNRLINIKSLDEIIKKNIYDLKIKLNDNNPSMYSRTLLDSLENNKDRINRNVSSLEKNFRNNLNILSKKIVHLTEKLGLLNPENVLSRGYVIVKSEDNIIKKAENLKKGDEITLRFYDSEKKAEVLE